MTTVLSTASGVIGNSQATLDQLACFAANEGLPSPPALAAWLGAAAIRRRSAPAAETDRPTFVALGTIEARKNHRLLLRIWSRLVARMGTKAPRLVIIGQRGWEADDVFRTLDRDQSLRGHVIELSNCSDQEVASHLESSRALLFPSEAEGFGLPLVEALGLGVPVIASDLPAFREIGQGIPTFLEPNDEASWEAAILDFAQPTSAARDGHLRRLGGFRLPTWDDHFRQVDAWLPSIDSRRAGRGSIRSGS